MLRFLFFLLICVKAYALQLTPQIVEGDCGGDTEDLIVFAKDIYNSKVFTWHDSLPNHQINLQSNYNILLSTTAQGWEYYMDENLVGHDKTAWSGSELYWLKDVKGEDSFIIVVEPFNWRMNTHYIYSVKASQIRNFEESASSFYGSTPPGARLEDTSIKEGKLLAVTIGRPWLIKDAKTNALYAIDTGYQYNFGSEWHILKLTDTKHGDEHPYCRIKFHLDISDAKLLLPKGVIKNFAYILDAVIGHDPPFEGTLRPNRNLREYIGHMWFNFIARPWSLANHKPYNTIGEVQIRLKMWSDKNRYNLSLYKKIKKLYPKVEKEIGSYYQKNFGLSKKEANDMAKTNLDIAFRTHFSFLRLEGMELKN